MKCLTLASLLLVISGLPAAFAEEAVIRLPRLAVAASVQESTGQSRENVEDLLMIELGNQPFLQLVDRQTLQAVMKEHAIALTNQANMKDSLALGKFAGADYVLYVFVVKDKASVRLVEVATGQVKVDEQVVLSENLALSLAAVREKVLAAIKPESQAKNRITVGIAQFPNHSGTGRSDKLGIELQKALRKRLSQESWAIVLERKYPKVLLDEVDLTRLGLVRDNAVETLPPADLVISGSLDDVSRVYEPNKPWEVTVDLTLRLRGQLFQVSQTGRSDAIEVAADDLMREIDAFRRKQPMSETDVPEKELWRRQALYLMPRRCETWADAIVPNFFAATKLNNLEVIRAWENVLLLDGDDPEAMTYLGICLIGFNRWSRDEAAVAQCIAGSRLVERAFRSYPNQIRSDTFTACIGAISTTALS